MPAHRTSGGSCEEFDLKLGGQCASLGPALLACTSTARTTHHEKLEKRLARLNLIRDILSRISYAGKKVKLVQPDPDIAFAFTPECIGSPLLAR